MEPNGRWVTIRGNHVFIATNKPRSVFDAQNPSGTSPIRRDELYLRAVRDLDLTTAQAMVDEEAAKAGFISTWRGWSEDYPDTDGRWFAEDKGTAEAHGVPTRYFLKLGRTREVYSNDDIGDIPRGVDTVFARESEGDTVYLIRSRTKQIRSADPVVYDKAGRVIPLSRRFV